MYEKLRQIAEEAATNVSRRQFVSRMGRAAAVAAGAIGSLLLTARDVHAGSGNNCCQNGYRCPPGKVCYGCKCVRIF